MKMGGEFGKLYKERLIKGGLERITQSDVLCRWCVQHGGLGSVA